VLGAVLALACLMAPPAASADDPKTVAEAQALLDQYQEEAAQAEQAYHDTHDQYTAAQAEADATTAEIAAMEAELADLQTQVAMIARQRYQTRGMTTTAIFFTSEDTDDLLYQVAATQHLTDSTNEVIQRYEVEQGSLADRKARLDAISATLAADDARMAELEQEAKDKAEQAQAALDELKAAEARAAALAARAAAASGTTTTTTSGGTSSGSAQVSTPTFVSDGSAAATVVAFALSKVGGPYVWGGNGPTGYDCSGLTRAAYLQVGIDLPHNAASQMGYGTPVSTDALAPGDLLFFYNPVGHVGIYIGDGQMVHASTYGVGIVVSSAFSIPITGARRLV
jgi:cell wall-associated NlpC family hydrolase